MLFGKNVLRGALPNNIQKKRDLSRNPSPYENQYRARTLNVKEGVVV
jgi:hypothetical protein